MQRNSTQVASGEASAQRAIAEISMEFAEQARAEAAKQLAMAEKNAHVCGAISNVHVISTYGSRIIATIKPAI